MGGNANHPHTTPTGGATPPRHPGGDVVQAGGPPPAVEQDQDGERALAPNVGPLPLVNQRGRSLPESPRPLPTVLDGVEELFTGIDFRAFWRSDVFTFGFWVWSRELV